MTIKRYDTKNPCEIKAGQFVCFEPLITDYVAGRPMKVVKISGSRIYVRDYHDEIDDGFKLLKSVLFVCDTKEEGDALTALNQDQFKAFRAAEQAVRDEYQSKIDAIIANSQ